MIAPVPTVCITKIGYALCHVMQSKDHCRFVLQVLKLNTEIRKLFLPVRGVSAENFAIFITILYNCCVT